MKNYLESSISMHVGQTMANLNYGWNDLCTETTIKTLVEGCAVYLGRNKSKDRPVAVELRDKNDKFHFGMYVQYIKQDEGDEGSWTLSMTFDEKDIDRENWTIVRYPEDQVLAGIIYDVGYTRYGAYYKYSPKETNNTICDGSPQELFCICVDGIVDYMRANVAIDPEMEMTNYFTCSAKLEADGSVYIGVEPSALMKQHIKDDAAIDNDNAKVA